MSSRLYYQHTTASLASRRDFDHDAYYDEDKETPMIKNAKVPLASEAANDPKYVSKEASEAFRRRKLRTSLSVNTDDDRTASNLPSLPYYIKKEKPPLSSLKSRARPRSTSMSHSLRSSKSLPQFSSMTSRPLRSRSTSTGCLISHLDKDIQRSPQKIQDAGADATKEKSCPQKKHSLKAEDARADATKEKALAEQAARDLIEEKNLEAEALAATQLAAQAEAEALERSKANQAQAVAELTKADAADSAKQEAERCAAEYRLAVERAKTEARLALEAEARLKAEQYRLSVTKEKRKAYQALVEARAVAEQAARDRAEAERLMNEAQAATKLAAQVKAEALARTLAEHVKATAAHAKVDAANAAKEEAERRASEYGLETERAETEARFAQEVEARFKEEQKRVARLKEELKRAAHLKEELKRAARLKKEQKRAARLKEEQKRAAYLKEEQKRLVKLKEELKGVAEAIEIEQANQALEKARADRLKAESEARLKVEQARSAETEARSSQQVKPECVACGKKEKQVTKQEETTLVVNHAKIGEHEAQKVEGRLSAQETVRLQSEEKKSHNKMVADTDENREDREIEFLLKGALSASAIDQTYNLDDGTEEDDDEDALSYEVTPVSSPARLHRSDDGDALSYDVTPVSSPARLHRSEKFGTPTAEYRARSIIFSVFESKTEGKPVVGTVEGQVSIILFANILGLLLGLRMQSVAVFYMCSISLGYGGAALFPVISEERLPLSNVALILYAFCHALYSYWLYVQDALFHEPGAQPTGSFLPSTGDFQVEPFIRFCASSAICSFLCLGPHFIGSIGDSSYKSRVTPWIGSGVALLGLTLASLSDTIVDDFLDQHIPHYPQLTEFAELADSYRLQAILGEIFFWLGLYLLQSAPLETQKSQADIPSELTSSANPKTKSFTWVKRVWSLFVSIFVWIALAITSPREFSYKSNHLDDSESLVVRTLLLSQHGFLHDSPCECHESGNCMINDGTTDSLDLAAVPSLRNEKELVHRREIRGALNRNHRRVRLHGKRRGR